VLYANENARTITNHYVSAWVPVDGSFKRHVVQYVNCRFHLTTLMFHSSGGSVESIDRRDQRPEVGVSSRSVTPLARVGDQDAHFALTAFPARLP
jgi:hypothetical protein